MIRSLALADVAQQIHGDLLGEDLSFDRVSTDTRTIESGDLFVALKGENFDGHRFADSAVANGAVAVVVSDEIDGLAVPQLKVADTTQELGDLARLNRKNYTGQLVALTGSCGKTTVKEMLSSILSGVGQTSATKGNLNNHIGAPQTLLAVDAADEFAVIEMGASGMGEIDYLAELAQPHVALVNNVAAAHLEGFGSEAGVAEEKSKIYRHLVSGGTAVINADNAYGDYCAETVASERPDAKPLWFSMVRTDVDCYATNVRLEAHGGYAFDINYQGRVYPVVLPLLGRQNVANGLAAASCAFALGVTGEQIVAGLQAVTPVKGRMVPHQLRSNLLIVDDTYNANPSSVVAAAEVLKDFASAGRNAVLVLGNLAELGEGRRQALAALGRELANVCQMQLITVGEDISAVSESFLAESAACGAGASRAQHFNDKEAALAYLNKQSWKETVMLVKGSRSARMEEVVTAIITSAEEAK